MPNALQSAGSQGRKQTAAAPIFVNRTFTGLWTQRNPLRDAATQYLIEKFYTGARFDSIIDGLNVEISNRLTPKRRCGASVYNSQTFPAINRFYEFRDTVNNAETIVLVADTAGSIYNATGPSTKTTIFSKSAGAGQASFQGVGTTLYFGDGIDQQKWMQPGGWVAQTAAATTQYAVGTSIIDSNGNLQYLNATFVGQVSNVALKANVVSITFSGTGFAMFPGMSFIPAVTTATFLNGKQLIALSVTPSGASFIVTAFLVHANYSSASDSGRVNTTDVTTPALTGSVVPPVWNASLGGTTADSGSVWTNFGPPVYGWAPVAPVAGPGLSGSGYLNQVIWRPFTAYASGAVLLDSTGHIQQSNAAGTSGGQLPGFTVVSGSGKPGVQDNTVTWVGSNWLAGAAGPAPWSASATPLIVGTVEGDTCVDSNGNLQTLTSGTGNTGSSAPSWNTTYGGTTTDSSLTWTNLGPYLGLAFKGWKYGYAFHAVDGSVSTMSPLSSLSNGVLGGVTVAGTGSGDVQVDAVWIFRTDDGGALPLYLTSLPNPGAGTAWSYLDSNPDSNLNLFVVGPQADSADPPPIGITALTYHLGRIFGAVGNTLRWSAGADSEFNGNTAWPPANNFVLPSLIVRSVPLTIGLLILTTSGIYFSGTGGVNQDVPLAPSPWMQGKVGGLLGYNALDIVGSTIYLVNSKKMCKAIDISGGESEIGFPIGDQLATGNSLNGTPINPASCYVSYHEQDSTDTALYLATPGAAGVATWFRMNPTPAPESGVMWSPIAQSTAGFSAVQSVETSPGVHQLLMGPPLGGTGPILFRDSTTFADNGTAYAAYVDIGSLVLAAPGQCALLYFITTDCTMVGSRPQVNVLMNEVGGHTKMLIYGSLLSVRSPDPPQLGPAESQTLYNDRWWLSASQQPAWCRHLQMEIAWPTENAGNELLTYTLFGEHYQEV